jgi:hypothetical protein
MRREMKLTGEIYLIMFFEIDLSCHLPVFTISSIINMGAGARGKRGKMRRITALLFKE